MSEHSRVRFDDDDSYEGREELSPRPSPLRRNFAPSPNEQRGRPQLRHAGSSSVRFMPGPTVASPQISSPVIRDPTPYHRPQPFEDSDGDDEEEDDASYPTRPSRSLPPQMDPSATSIPALGDPPRWKCRKPRHARDDSWQDDLPNQEQQSHFSPRQSVATSHSDEYTIYGEDDKNEYDKEPSVPPLAYLRRGDETIRPTPLRPALKPNSSHLEEGGIRAQRGFLSNLMSIYGISKHRADYDDLTLSRATTMEAAAARGNRMDSMASEMGYSERKPLDPDHPDVTGVKKNTKSRRKITNHIACKWDSSDYLRIID